MARILEPGSKLATARALSPATTTASLGLALGLGEVDEDELYTALDWLRSARTFAHLRRLRQCGHDGRDCANGRCRRRILERQPAIETALARRHLKHGTLVLYDVSSSYMEGRCCPLAKPGYSRDGRKGTRQITYGLLCGPDGCPVAIEVFAGNTADPMTLGQQIEKLKGRFRLDHVVLMGDRGMIHFTLNITDTDFSFSRDNAAIDSEAATRL